MSLIDHPAKSGFAVLTLLLFAACDPSQQPLVFGSSNILGVDISVSPTNTQPVTATLGYKSLDLSVVPTTTKSSAGVPNPIRGCFIAGAAFTCPDDMAPIATSHPAAAAPPEAAAASSYVPDPATPERPTMALLTQLRPTALLVPPALQGTAEVNPGGPRPKFAEPRARATQGVLPAPGEPAQAGIGSMRDALSVYSSFNTGVGATGGLQSAPQSPSAASPPLNASINLGKVFATGVAAQFLSYGQYYFLQASAGAECVRQLANAVKDKLEESTILKICGSPGSPGNSK